MSDLYMRSSTTAFENAGKRVIHPRSKTAAVANLNKSQPVLRKYHFISRNPFEFGNSTPKWTIPSSRHEPRAPYPIPPPGYYTIPEDSGRNTMNHIIQDREDCDYSTITSNIDFTCNRVFPEKKPLHINNRGGIVYSYKSENHEPVFVYNTFGGRNATRISERMPAPVPDPVPSPTHYNPVHPKMETSVVATIPKAKERDLNKEILKNDTPGPGSYDITESVRPYTNWTSRLRVKSNRYHPPTENTRPWDVAKSSKK